MNAAAWWVCCTALLSSGPGSRGGAVEGMARLAHGKASAGGPPGGAPCEVVGSWRKDSREHSMLSAGTPCTIADQELLLQ